MKPALGRVVVYVEARGARVGEERAAIVHGIYTDAMAVDVTVMGPGFAEPRMFCEVPFDEDGRPHSWHWPMKA